MKRLFNMAIAIAMLNLQAISQRRAASYPFEFSKGFLAKIHYNSYFLQDAVTKQFMLVLRDNEKADYILYNNQFAVNGKQYFGYYDRDEKQYVIDEIFIINSR